MKEHPSPWFLPVLVVLAAWLLVGLGVAMRWDCVNADLHSVKECDIMMADDEN